MRKLKAIEKKESYNLWQTNWLIIGPKMPEQELRLSDNIVIAKLNDEAFKRMSAAQVPVTRINYPGANYAAHHPPFEIVQSRYRLQVDIRALDQDDAVKCASEIVNRLLVSLSLTIDGSRYRAELRAAKIAGQAQEYTAWSHPMSFAAFPDPGDLHAADMERSLDLFRRIDQNGILSNAYENLMAAWQLQDTVGTKPLQRSVLQHYVLSIETIVNGVAKDIRASQQDKIRQAERLFASEFSDSIQGRADKPKAIREASNKLREIGLQNTIPCIDSVGPMLTIPTNIVEHAKELYRFRSRNLSHPGKANAEELSSWLNSDPATYKFCAAEIISRAFINGYYNYITDR